MTLRVVDAVLPSSRCCAAPSRLLGLLTLRAVDADMHTVLHTTVLFEELYTHSPLSAPIPQAHERGTTALSLGD